MTEATPKRATKQESKSHFNPFNLIALKLVQINH